MRYIFPRASITVLVGAAFLGGCATPPIPAVAVQPVACAAHYRDLTQRWDAAEYRCAETGHPLPPPRIRTLVDRPAVAQERLARGQHDVR